jgi:hypothetical protein
MLTTGLCPGPAGYSNLSLPEIKVKVKLSLSLTKHHAMKMYWWIGGIEPHIL